MRVVAELLFIASDYNQPVLKELFFISHVPEPQSIRTLLLCFVKLSMHHPPIAQ
jgi:hypothetical protein